MSDDSNLEPGIDFGSYTPNVTGEHLKCARDRFGIEWASIGLQGNPYAEQQIDTALSAGLKIDTYLIPRSWYMEPAPLVAAQLRRINQYHGQIAPFVWFDVETLPGESPGPDVVLPWTRIALKLIDDAGWQGSIYTSASMWDELTAGSGEFTARPLWEALYGPYRMFRTFGGWSKRAGVQWAGSTLLCDLNVDLNTWETKEQTMTDEQIKGLIGECLAQEARLGAKVDANALAIRNEVLVQGILLATGRDKDAENRIRFEAAAAGVTLP
jgi:hypothetical protein